MELPGLEDQSKPMRALLGEYLREVNSIASAVDPHALEGIAHELLVCQGRGRVVFAIGNGGSAATASHFACDLAKGTRNGGAPTFKVVALTDNMPLITAWANDKTYDDVFAEQLASLGRPGDLLIAMSVSGTSPSIINAVSLARSRGMTVIGLTGRSGGKLASLTDLAIKVPSTSMEIVEDVHMIITHSLCVALRQHFSASRLSDLALMPDRLAG